MNLVIVENRILAPYIFIKTMLDDIWASAKENLVERLSSPLLGGFSIAWCLWNYKFLVILLSDASVTTTFALIDKIAFPDPYSCFIRGFILPLLSAIAYVFLYPYPAKFVFGFTRRRQKEVNSLRQLIEGETLLSIADSRKLRGEIFLLEENHQEELDRLNAEISRLKSSVENTQIPREFLPETEASFNSRELQPTQWKLLDIMEKKDGRCPEPELVSLSGSTKVKAEFDLAELVGKNILERTFSQNARVYVYTFTQEGRRLQLTKKPG